MSKQATADEGVSPTNLNVQAAETADQQPVVVPDRFESLQRKAGSKLSTIVQPVDASLKIIDSVFTRMHGAERGAFLIMRGPSGAGKSTFLHTIDLYRDDVRTESVPGGVQIREYLRTFEPGDQRLTVLVLEEREAATSFSDSELEDWLHAINGFIRSEKGSKALVVWPCNTDELRDRVVELAGKVGGSSLLGTGTPWHDFSGPPKSSYIKIAENTLSTLNQMATLSDLGLTVENLELSASKANTIGTFLAHVHDQIEKASNTVESLLEKEQCRLWVIVAAASDVEGDVAGLTRGRFAQIDTERLMASTGANIVQDLKNYPDKVGILGTVMDARILHLPILAASSIARGFADDSLKVTMKGAGLSLKPDSQGPVLERLKQTELASIFASGTQGVLARGGKPGSESIEAFRKLANIASNNDTALNRALGRALVAAGLIDSFEVEKDFGTGMKRKTDILAKTPSGPIRIEVMWRSSTGRAEIANYVLTKLANYGRALQFLD